VLPAFARVLADRPALAHDDGDAQRTAQPAGVNPIAVLFANGLALRTGLLWLLAFVIFLVSYALGYWIPTLLAEAGFSPDRAPLGSAAFGVGGLVGSILILSVVGRLGIELVLVLASLVAIVCIAALSQATASPGLVLPLIAGAGAGLIGCSVGQGALAVSLYPAEVRATGVGWAAAIGRIGSIVGPAAGGAMLSIGWPLSDIVLTAVLPISLAIGALGTMLLMGAATMQPRILERATEPGLD
jgi:MFS transporter, AAHS family, 4-hydroxybenzoate transporter